MRVKLGHVGHFGLAVHNPEWDSVAATVEKHFRLGDPTAGLVAGIEEVGHLLARHFPRKPSSSR
jgi:uncharacterized membrane protein